MSFRVGFLGDGLQFGRTGLGNYAYYLLLALAERDDELRYTVFFNYLRRPPVQPRDLDLPCSAHVRYRTSRYPNDFYSRCLYELGLPAELVYGRHHVLHSPDAVGPRRSAAPLVVTFHDLIPYVLPRLYPDRYTGLRETRAMQRYLRQVPLTLQRADRIIAISQNTAQDLQDIFHVPAERIDVIPYGRDPRFQPRPREDCLPVLRRYGLDDRPYVLLVGRVEYRKNHVTALRAIQLLRARGQLTDHRVVLCGGAVNASYGRRSQQEIDSLAMDDLAVIGYVQPEDMPYFYAAASLLLFPTRYEGFGFPALEAMGSGIPVVTSGNSSLPEVVGPAALLVDSEDVEELAEATARTVYDEPLRAQLIQAGLRQAATFSWARAAGETVAAYRRLL
jgi:alpha-1,3-rhamnosyl/mannosyltransferase